MKLGEARISVKSGIPSCRDRQRWTSLPCCNYFSYDSLEPDQSLTSVRATNTRRSATLHGATKAGMLLTRLTSTTPANGCVAVRPQPLKLRQTCLPASSVNQRHKLIALDLAIRASILCTSPVSREGECLPFPVMRPATRAFPAACSEEAANLLNANAGTITSSPLQIRALVPAVQLPVSQNVSGGRRLEPQPTTISSVSGQHWPTRPNTDTDHDRPTPAASMKLQWRRTRSLISARKQALAVHFCGLFFLAIRSEFALHTIASRLTLTRQTDETQLAESVKRPLHPALHLSCRMLQTGCKKGVSAG